MEEWVATNKSRMVGLESSTQGGKGGSHYVKKNRTGPHSGGGKTDRDKQDSSCHPSLGTHRHNGRCKKCGVFGHWVK